MGIPLVTIVIPVYNRSRMLAQALCSLRNQVSRDFVVTICDDASAEPLEKVIKQFRDLEIRYHRFSCNVGAQLNHQRGADLCETRYGLFLNSDDLLLPGAVKSMVTALEEDGSAAACLGGVIEFSEDENQRIKFSRIQLPFVPSESASWFFGLTNISGISPSQTLVRMDAFRKVGGFNLGCQTVYDWELFLSLRARYSIQILGEVTTAYRIHREQLTRRNSISEDALNARDALFVMSSRNPLRRRLGIGLVRQSLFRQTIGWRLIRLAFSADNRFRHFRNVIFLLTKEHVLLPLVIFAPVWAVAYTFTRGKLRASPATDGHSRAAVRGFYEAISQVKPPPRIGRATTRPLPKG